MKIGICGHFGGKHNFLDGQTVKTKIVCDALCEKHGQTNIKKVDTYNIKKRFVSVFLGTIGLFFSCDACVMLPAHNGLKVFSLLFCYLKKLFRKKIYYVVIGGWLPGFIQERPKIKDSLKSFDMMFVETETMKRALEDMGYANVTVLPNFKRLNLVDRSKLSCTPEPPYKLCTFSRVMREKGIEDAINAVCKANAQIGQNAFSLDIYGQVDDGYKADFESVKEKMPEYIAYKGLVDFDKSTQILCDYYALLFPTYYSGEGFAGTLIDAFASALPVIASDWKYNPEIVDSSVGVLFEAKNADMLSQVLVDFYNGKYDIAQMRVSCLEKAANYSFEHAKELLSEHIKP